MLLIAMGLLFQIPVAIVAVTRVGIVTTSQLAHNRRYAILAIALAMVNEPELIFLDEPITALVPRARWNPAVRADSLTLAPVAMASSRALR